MRLSILSSAVKSITLVQFEVIDLVIYIIYSRAEKDIIIARESPKVIIFYSEHFSSIKKVK